MEVILVLLGVLILLDIAALYWGVDSRDSLDSPAWHRPRK